MSEERPLSDDPRIRKLQITARANAAKEAARTARKAKRRGLTVEQYQREEQHQARLAADVAEKPSPRPNRVILRFGSIVVRDGPPEKLVKTPSGEGWLAGAHVTVDSAGEIDRRVTATRLILTGPFAFGLRKKKDNRELYLLVEGRDYAHVEEVNPEKRKQALEFAAQFNQMARS